MCHLLDGTSIDRKQGQRVKKEQCSLRLAMEERQLMEVEAELLQMWREGAHCTGVSFK
jgi:hypothetical protein